MSTESDVPCKARDKVKFELYGKVMMEKTVKRGGSSGRICVPLDWVGHRVKVIRED